MGCWAAGSDWPRLRAWVLFRCRLGAGWFASAGVFASSLELSAGRARCQGPAAPCRAGLRPAWTTAAPSSFWRLLKARPEGERQGLFPLAGTPSPSVASEVRTITDATERERRAHLQAMGSDARLRKHGDRGRGLARGGRRRAAGGHRARPAAGRRRAGAGSAGRSGRATTRGRDGAGGGRWT